MRAPLLTTLCGVLIACGTSAETPALKGTWSPDRQVAVAEELAGDGSHHWFFRDQRTGANLGDIPQVDPRPRTDQSMQDFTRAAWNFAGSRVALLIDHGFGQPDPLDLRLFSRGADGRFVTVAFTPPDPVILYRKQRGKTLPKNMSGFVEAGLGPWTGGDALLLTMSKRRDIRWRADGVFYYAQCKVRFRTGRADATEVKLVVLPSGRAYAHYTDAWGMDFRTWTDVPADTHEADGSTGAADRIIIGHDVVSERITLDAFSLREAADSYQKDFGRFPTGDDREISRQLFGLNPRHKDYAGLGLFTHDRDGRPVDLWNEPYVFAFDGDHACVYSKRLEANQQDKDAGRQWPESYDPLYYFTRADTARGGSYRLALGIRLAVRRAGRVPSWKELRHLLFASPDAERQTILELNGRSPDVFLRDPWGTPYVVKLTADHVTVSSVHMPGEVYTETFLSSP